MSTSNNKENPKPLLALAEDAAHKDMKRILPNIDCSPEAYEVNHEYSYGKDPSKNWKRKVILPKKGRFVGESHYVTKSDVFPHGRFFANKKDENIKKHLQRSFELYKAYDPDMTFDRMYQYKWSKQWTPAEKGKIGQGSVGEIQVKELTPEMEMWFMTMMWANGERPKRGTKFLLEANGRAVVVVAGYETGPGQEQYLGGVTREVHMWLGTSNNSKIKVSLLQSQYEPLGPVTCR